jgi:hypothetical protein
VVVGLHCQLRHCSFKLDLVHPAENEVCLSVSVDHVRTGSLWSFQLGMPENRMGYLSVSKSYTGVS